MSAGDADRRRLRGALAFSVVLLAFAGYLLYDATRIRQGGGFTVVGPQAFPLAAAGMLVVLAALLTLRATVWPDAGLADHCEAEARGTHWPTVGMITALLVAYPITIGALGYVVATTIFVPIAAAILGSARPWRDLAVGVGLAVIVYLGFTRLLGVRLPAGILPF